MNPLRYAVLTHLKVLETNLTLTDRMSAEKNLERLYRELKLNRKVPFSRCLPKKHQTIVPGTLMCPHTTPKGPVPVCGEFLLPIHENQTTVFYPHWMTLEKVWQGPSEFTGYRNVIYKITKPVSYARRHLTWYWVFGPNVCARVPHLSKLCKVANEHGMI